MNTPDTYTLTNTFHYPNAIVRVYRPELTKEERARRMAAIEKQAVNLLKSTYGKG